MDETTLTALLDHAVGAEPPMPGLAERSLRASRRLRRRRQAVAAVASAATVAAAAAVAPAAGRLLVQPPPAAAGQATAMAYVATSDRTVVPVRLATGTALRPVRLRLRAVPVALALAPDGRTLYVLAGDVLTPISTATGEPGRSIRIGGRPTAIVLVPGGATAYVLEEGTGVVRVNLAAGSVGALIALPGARQMLLAPDGRTVYVLSGPPQGTGQQITGVDVATGAKQPPVRLPGNVIGFSVGPGGRVAYALVEPLSSARISLRNGRGTVRQTPEAGLIPVDLATGAAKAPIVLPAGASLIAGGVRGLIAYVAGAGQITPVRLAYGFASVPFDLPAGTVAGAFAVTPDGSRAYVASPRGPMRGLLIPVSTATGSAGRPIRIEGRPLAIVLGR